MFHWTKILQRGRLSNGFIWAAMNHGMTYEIPMAQNDGKLSVPPYRWVWLLSWGTIERFTRDGQHYGHWISTQAMRGLYRRLRDEGLLKEVDLHASLLPDPAAEKGFKSNECKFMRSLAIEDGRFAALYDKLH